MKILFLVRHAKSSWNKPALPDKDRSLNDRGKRDAPRMGEQLAKRDVRPDLILSSPARRALATAQIIAKKLDYKCKGIVVDDRLYAVEADDLLRVIRKLGDKPKHVMLVGHNPELSEFVHRLFEQYPHADVCRRRIHVRCEVLVKYRQAHACESRAPNTKASHGRPSSARLTR